MVLGRIESPNGWILVVCDSDHRLRALDFHDHEDRMLRPLRRQYEAAIDLRSGMT
jgi:methylated-DNA-[protein]-cysteine S-methyltransferase